MGRFKGSKRGSSKGSGRKSSRKGSSRPRSSREGRKSQDSSRPDGRGRRNFGSSRGGKSSRDSRSKSSSRPRRGHLSMHRVICDKCGAKCEVPFLPSQDKPVYCSNCFGSEGPVSAKSNGPSQKDLNQINEKLDKILEILESF